MKSEQELDAQKIETQICIIKCCVFSWSEYLRDPNISLEYKETLERRLKEEEEALQEIKEKYPEFFI